MPAPAVSGTRDQARSVPAFERELAFPFPRIVNRVVCAQHEWLRPGVHDPASRYARELPCAGVGHRYEFGDPVSLDEETSVREVEDGQLEGSRLAGALVRPAVVANELIAVSSGEHKRRPTAEFTRDDSSGQIRDGCVCPNGTLAVVPPEMRGLADDPVPSR